MIAWLLLLSLAADAKVSCEPATAAQRLEVNRGLELKTKFLAECAEYTGGSKWCEQLTRPNPDSRAIFKCTYGTKQEAILIHPDRSTWKNAFEAAKIVAELDASGIKPCLIYNWWRPEPYNRNVKGKPPRHPFGTAVDVLFCTKIDKDRAFDALCAMKRAGRINAVGYYPSQSLHIGVGDKLKNTWGKTCSAAKSKTS